MDINARKRTLTFLGELGTDAITIAPIARSAGYLSVGNVVTFFYQPNRTGTGEDPTPIVLIVATKKGNGIIISPRGNRLLTGFIISNLSTNTASIILKKMYNNTHISYDMMNRLMGRFIGGSYRTWDLRFLNNLEEVLINVNNLTTDEEDR